MSDDGLTEATQRVRWELSEHAQRGVFECACGWRAERFSTAARERVLHLGDVLARAAREDVADRIQQARAGALDEAAKTHVAEARDTFWRDDAPFHSYGRFFGERAAEWLHKRAAAIRDGEA